MSDRRKTALTHEGWYYVLVVSFIVVGAVWRQVNLMIVLSGLMIGPVLLNWRISAATIRRLQVRRHMPDCVHAGESFGVEMTVRNLRRRLSSWFVGVTDRISYVGGALQTHLSDRDVSLPGGTACEQAVVRPRTHSSDVDVLLPQTPAGELSKATYRCSLPARGEYKFGPMSVFTRFPLGLLKCSRAVAGTETLIAFPRLGTLTKSWYDLVRSRQTGFQRSLNRRALTEGGDFYGVRDWQAGDSRRSIHWRMTAKLGELAVRQFEELDSFDLTLVLDLWDPENDEAAVSDDVELAVSFAATVVHEACRQSGARLRVILLGDRIWELHGLATPRFRLQVMQELAFRRPSCGSDAKGQLQRLLVSPERHEQAVVISTRTSAQAAVTPGNGDTSPLSAVRLHWFCVGDQQFGQYFQIRSRESELSEFTSKQDAQHSGKHNGRSSTRPIGRRARVGA